MNFLQYTLSKRTVMNEEEIEIALQNCDKEAIHTPQKIQSFAAIIGISKETNKIIFYSKNLFKFIDIKEGVEILDSNFADILPSCIKNIEKILEHKQKESEIFEVDKTFIRVLHHKEYLTLELQDRDFSCSFLESMQIIQKSTSAISKANNSEEVFELILSKLREFTGFDRAMLYKFDENFDGTVIFESKKRDLNSFLEHTFPASDIPKNARDMYAKNPIRVISDVDDIPIDLILKEGIESINPIDMSYLHSRAVAPIHIEYLKNMSVVSSMSISIISRGELWGLIAFHNNSPLYVPLQKRICCEEISKMLSNTIENIEISEGSYEENLKLKALNELFKAIMYKGVSSILLLKEEVASNILLSVVDSNGVTLKNGENIKSYGVTPSENEVEMIIDLFKDRDESVISVQCLSSFDTKFEKIRKVASGVLFLNISKEIKILWYKPEVSKLIAWAGQPIKSFYNDEGKLKISPRKSFETYHEEVHLKSKPWSKQDLEFAQKIYNLHKESQRYKDDDVSINFEDESRRYLQIFDLLDQAVVTTDIDGHISYVNRSFEEMSGYKYKEVRGELPSILKSGNHEREFYANMWSTILSLQIWHGVVTNRDKNGEVFVVDMMISPLVNKHGEILGFVSVGHNITDHISKIEACEKINSDLKSASKVIEQDLYELKAIEDANIKFRIKKDILIQISHHWRQPLTVLNMLVSDIKDAYEEGALDIEYIKGFEKSALDMIFLMSSKINEFSSYFKPSGERKRFSVNECIERTVVAIKPTLKSKNIEISFEMEKNLYIYGYMNALTRILIEILNNIVDITESRNLKFADIKISTFEIEENIIIEISDNCGGIEDFGEIFDPYYSTKKAKNNVGIGLFAVKTILQEHFNGKIEARNGTLGAIFRIEITKDT